MKKGNDERNTKTKSEILAFQRTFVNQWDIAKFGNGLFGSKISSTQFIYDLSMPNKTL